jgi:hypothetical protein
MLRSWGIAALCASFAMAIPAGSAVAEMAEGYSKQKSFREHFWSALKEQGWIFITYSNSPSSDVPVADWFFQSVRNRGQNIRSAWVLDVYYEPVGFDPEVHEAPNYQSEKARYWIDCAEISSQVRVWHRYKNAFGTDLTVTGIIFPRPIDLPSSAPMELREQQPDSIGEAIVKAICAAPIATPTG